MNGAHRTLLLVDVTKCYEIMFWPMLRNVTRLCFGRCYEMLRNVTRLRNDNHFSFDGRKKASEIEASGLDLFRYMSIDEVYDVLQ